MSNDDIQRRIDNDGQYREALCDWLRANGINPNHVPSGTRPSIADGQMTLRMWKLNDQGKTQADPDDPFSLAKHTVTVPVVVSPTPDVEVWLTPPCPTCGSAWLSG